MEQSRKEENGNDKTLLSPGVVVRVSIAVRRYHDHGNSYFGKNI